MIGDENEGNLIDEANFQIEPANFFGAAANPSGHPKKQAVHSQRTAASNGVVG